MKPIFQLSVKSKVQTSPVLAPDGTPVLDASGNPEMQTSGGDVLVTVTCSSKAEGLDWLASAHPEISPSDVDMVFEDKSAASLQSIKESRQGVRMNYCAGLIRKIGAFNEENVAAAGAFLSNPQALPVALGLLLGMPETVRDLVKAEGISMGYPQPFVDAMVADINSFLADQGPAPTIEYAPEDIPTAP